MAFPELGRVGVWTIQLDGVPSAEARDAAREIEDLGFRTLWIPESRRREVFANAALLLGATRSLVVATGIANIYTRDPMTMAAGQKTLSEAFPDRFVLGVGVGHRLNVERDRGRTYGPPIETMRAYLDAMDAAPFDGPAPASTSRILAALRPKMVELARDRADGAHPYHTTPGHTREARTILGPGKLLAPEQAVILETDPDAARALARSRIRNTLTQPNYLRNLERLGFSEEDLADGGSDRLVDALVAWGDADAIVGRIREHLDAGADHVAVQVIPPDAGAVPMAAWRRLAEATAGL